MADGVRVEIQYCMGCRWLLRAAWMAQELLTTFERDLGEVALVPSAEGGTYQILVDGTPIFDRKQAGRFPEASEIKQRLRDIVDPDRDLGHVDRGRDGSE